MNKRIIFIIAFFLFGVTAVVLVGKASAFPFNQQAHPMGFGPPSFGGPNSMRGMPPGGPLGHQLRLIQSLGLSDVQQQKVESIISEYRPKVQAKVIALQQGRMQLRSMAGSDLNEDIVNKLANTQGQTITHLIKIRSKIGRGIRSILTEKQKNQLATMIASRPQQIPPHFPFNQ